MARLPVPGSDEGQWGAILNDYLSATHKPDGTLKDNIITSAAVQDGSLSGSKLADNTITQPKLAAGAPGNGQVLSYNGSGLAWITPPSGVTTLNALSDVNVTGAIDGQSLIYQSGTWISATVGSGGGVTDHGALTGLPDDDHPQYLNTARGDARYYTQAQVDTSLSGKADTSHTHSASAIASGTIATARLGSGTASASTYLRGDGTWATPAGGTASTSGSQSFTYTGTLQTGTGALPLYNDSGVSRTITSVRASVGGMPTGSAIIVDVNINATTIFTTQSQRPTIAVNASTSGAVARSATWGNGQRLTVDVDQVGSSTAGSDLIVTVEYS